MVSGNTWAELKERVKAHRTSPNPLVRRGLESLTAAYRLWSKAITLAANPTQRSFVSLRLFSRNLHQDRGDTAMDRFPELFAAARKFFGERQDLRILSFGCSTGEEVLTLRQYFPSAAIVGAEINGASLAICRGLDVDDRIIFVRSKPREIEKRAPFDAIFCMAMLQRIPLKKVHGQPPPSLKDHYPFERFDRQLTEFDRWLKTSGLLVIHAKAYVLADASVAGNYVPYAGAPEPAPDGRKYDRNSERSDDARALGSIFVKIG